MRAITEKPIAVVRLEGCLQDGDGALSEYGAERLRDLCKTHYVWIASPLAASDRGLKKVFAFLGQNDLPYDQVWAAHGLPEYDEWYGESEPW